MRSSGGMEKKCEAVEGWKKSAKQWTVGKKVRSGGGVEKSAQWWMDGKIDVLSAPNRLATFRPSEPTMDVLSTAK